MDVCRLRHGEEERAVAALHATRGHPAEVTAGPADGAGSLRRHHSFVRAFDALSHASFRRYWFAALAVSVTMWAHAVAVPHLLYRVTGEPVWAGLAAFAQFGTALLAAPVGGLLAGSVRPVAVLAGAHAVLAVTALSLALAASVDAPRPALVLALVAVVGAATGVLAPSWQTFLPRLVGRDRVVDAIALNALQAHMARAMGPLVGGVLVAVSGPPAAFGLFGAGAAVMLATLVLVRPPLPPPPHPAERALARLLAGVRYTERHLGLATAIATTALVAFVGLPVVQLAPVFARQTFDVGAAGSGLLAAALGIGAVAGCVVVAGTARDVCRSTLLWTATLGHGLAAVALGLAPAFPVAVAAVLALGATYLVATSAASGTIAVLAGDAFRGRVVSLAWMGFAAGYPVGALVQGWLAGVAGPRVAVAGSGAVLAVLVTVAAVDRRVLRSVDSHVHR